MTGMSIIRSAIQVTLAIFALANASPIAYPMVLNEKYTYYTSLDQEHCQYNRDGEAKKLDPDMPIPILFCPSYSPLEDYETICCYDEEGRLDQDKSAAFNRASFCPSYDASQDQWKRLSSFKVNYEEGCSSLAEVIREGFFSVATT